MIAVASDLERVTRLQVRVTQNRPDGPYRLISFQIATDDLLVGIDEVNITAGPTAFAHESKMTPLMREITRRLFGRQESGARKMTVTLGLITLRCTPEPRFDANFYKSVFVHAADFVDGIAQVLDAE